MIGKDKSGPLTMENRVLPLSGSYDHGQKLMPAMGKRVLIY